MSLLIISFSSFRTFSRIWSEMEADLVTISLQKNSLLPTTFRDNKLECFSSKTKSLSQRGEPERWSGLTCKHRLDCKNLLTYYPNLTHMLQHSTCWWNVNVKITEQKWTQLLWQQANSSLGNPQLTKPYSNQPNLTWCNSMYLLGNSIYSWNLYVKIS